MGDHQGYHKPQPLDAYKVRELVFTTLINMP